MLVMERNNGRSTSGRCVFVAKHADCSDPARSRLAFLICLGELGGLTADRPRLTLSVIADRGQTRVPIHTHDRVPGH